MRHGSRKLGKCGALAQLWDQLAARSPKSGRGNRCVERAAPGLKSFDCVLHQPLGGKPIISRSRSASGILSTSARRSIISSIVGGSSN